MTRVAAIDCGTNSIRLLVAEQADGAWTDRHRETRIVRLGEGVDRTGRLAPTALDRVRGALADYAAVIRSYECERVRLVATSAARDARNADEFTALVSAVIGVEPDIVTGAVEAGLSFAGAVDVVPDPAERVLVADIGGGSTELVLGRPGEPTGLRARSVDIGSVRLTERHFADDPPTPIQVSSATADVRAALTDAARTVPPDEATRLIGVAGTVTTVAAMALGLDRYDSAAIHGAALSAAAVEDVTGRLLTMTRDERSAVPVIHPGRVDVIAAGALILRELLAAVGPVPLTVSEHDILDGIARSLA